MPRPHRAHLTASRLPLRRRAGAPSAWLHMPVPEHNPAPPPPPPPPPTPQGPDPDAPEVVDPPLPGERAPRIEPDRPAPMQRWSVIGWHRVASVDIGLHRLTSPIGGKNLLIDAHHRIDNGSHRRRARRLIVARPELAQNRLVELPGSVLLAMSLSGASRSSLRAVVGPASPLP